MNDLLQAVGHGRLTGLPLEPRTGQSLLQAMRRGMSSYGYGGMTGRMSMMGSEDMANMYKVGLNTSRLLLSLGDVVIGWLLLRQAEVALAALTAGPGSERDKDFYTGKVAAAKFFAQTRLPLLHGERVIVEGTNLEIMEIPESAF